ncbi:MAG: CHAT domain-containing protein, partial [Caldilineaceae bacterium]
TIAAARAGFEEMGLVVEAALSTAILPDADSLALLAAARLLDDALPHQAWRSWLALARAREAAAVQASVQGAASLLLGDLQQEGHLPEAALDPLVAWTETVRRLVRLRAAAPTEHESATFFEAHAPIFADAMAGALRAGDIAAALAAADAALTPAFAAQLARHAPILAVGNEDAYLTRLIDDEARARSALETARTDLRTHGEGVEQGLVTVRALSAEHARSLSRLRIARPRARTLQPPDLLDPDTLRDRCGEAHGERWACLSMHFDANSGALEIFWLDPYRLRRFERRLGPIEMALLRQATDPNPAFRQLVYGGNVYGQRVNVTSYGLRLGKALLPPEVWALFEGEPVLYVATHGALQNLALPVLTNGEATLLQRAEIVQVPSLTSLQRLLERNPAPTGAGVALVMGVESFGNRAPRLPATAGECAAVAHALAPAGDVRVLLREQATRAALDAIATQAHLAQMGTLPGMAADAGPGFAIRRAAGQPVRLLHLATHARADRLAPLRSHILLHGEDELTAAEIVALNLECELVTLSACSGALGEPLAGNELLSLAYAFLQGGARTVLAALWPVEDVRSVAFMTAFYEHLATSPQMRPATALRRAQHAQEAGNPLDWAGYRLIGAA